MRFNAPSVTLFLVIMLTLLTPSAALLSFGQNSQSTTDSVQSKYEIVKTTRSLRFDFPYTASNNDRTHPLVYTFVKPISESWILNVDNNISYATRPDAKTVIKLQEPKPSEKFIEIAMYGGISSNRFWAAVNTREAGYIRLYDKNGIDGWSATQPIIIGYDSNQGLTISSGTKVLVDRLSVNGFTLGSIAVYGKDDPNTPRNTDSGNISFQVLWGRPADSPIYYLPLVMLVGVGGVLIGLLVFKKRDKIEAK
ncbi:MAG TPA: hypothetical protein VFI73_02685 [Candidatus Nitrosopolaris sp.]|nr:hypothetical protein [Candidatus Nitrosopolaris sp.]